MMHQPNNGKITTIRPGLAVQEFDQDIMLILEGKWVMLNAIEAIHLRNILTSWKNDKTKRDNKAKYRKSTSENITQTSKQ
jgi:hypothetical protein